MSLWCWLAVWAVFLLAVYLFMVMEVAWYNVRVRRFFTHLQQMFLEDED